MPGLTVTDERIEKMLSAAVKAIGTSPRQAAQVFRLVTSDSPEVADAWLGLAASGDRSLSTLEQLAATADSVGRDLRRLGLAPADLGARFETDYLALRIEDGCTARLAYAGALMDVQRWADAHSVLATVARQPQSEYVHAVLHRRTERWADVLTAVSGCSDWLDTELVRAGLMLEAIAAANLGLLDRASSAAGRVVREGSGDALTRDALFQQALIVRHRGEGEAAQALLTDIRVRWPEFGPAAAALGDPTFGLVFVDAATIDSRTDRWDPASATTSEQRAAAETAASAKDLLVDAETRLGAMVGLDEVKSSVKRLRSDSIARVVRARKRLPTPPVSRHLLMVGPPGVGKTVTARIVSNMFCGLGIVARPELYETKRSKLLGTHLGETEANTLAILEKASGATVFIDEFGGLIQADGSGSNANAYGQAVIDTLVPWMENERGNTVLIAGGYPQACQRVIQADQGLLSRFKTILTFHSYTPDELLALAETFAAEAGDALDPGVGEDVLRAPFQRFYERESVNNDGDVVRDIDILGNGRFVRNVIEAAQAVRNERVIGDYGLATVDLADTSLADELDEEALTRITRDDLHAGFLEVLPPAARPVAAGGAGAQGL